jgi:hypothetical protein
MGPLAYDKVRVSTRATELVLARARSRANSPFPLSSAHKLVKKLSRGTFRTVV